LLDRDLAIFGGIANILRGGTFDVGELLLKGGDDVFGFIEAERGLGQVGDAVGIGNGERPNLLGIADYLGYERSLAESTDDFIVVVVTDEDERITFLGKFDGFDVDFGDERAGGVDNAQAAAGAVLADFGRNAVGAVNDAFAVGTSSSLSTKMAPFAAEFVDHEAVVDDFLADVDGRAEGLEGDADDVDGADDAGAEAARL